MPRAQSDPTEIFRLRDSLYAVELVSAAIIEFDFFTWLENNPADGPAICRHFGLQPRPTDVMLTLFSSLNLVTRKEGTFYLTASAREFLVQHSRFYIGPYFATLKARPVLQDMVRVLRTGKPANWGSFKDEKEWAKAMESEPFARGFTGAMDCRGLYLGPFAADKVDCSRHTRLLDIAGGSGVYACAFVSQHPHLTASVLEKPPVDAIARQLIKQRGFDEKVSVLVADMFGGPLPTGFDIHLFSNVLHDWDVPEVKQLLQKSYDALPTGGMLVVHDMHIDAGKTGPYPVAAYSAMLMNVTEGKCYSEAELQEYFDEIGFRFQAHIPTKADRSVVIASRQ